MNACPCYSFFELYYYYLNTIDFIFMSYSHLICFSMSNFCWIYSHKTYLIVSVRIERLFVANDIKLVPSILLSLQICALNQYIVLYLLNILPYFSVCFCKFLPYIHIYWTLKTVGDLKKKHKTFKYGWTWISWKM